jgi:hypothetical protein
VLTAVIGQLQLKTPRMRHQHLEHAKGSDHHLNPVVAHSLGFHMIEKHAHQTPRSLYDTNSAVKIIYLRLRNISSERGQNSGTRNLQPHCNAEHVRHTPTQANFIVLDDN